MSYWFPLDQLFGRNVYTIFKTVPVRPHPRNFVLRKSVTPMFPVQTFPEDVLDKSSQHVKVSSERQHICSFCLKHVHDDLDCVHPTNSISFWICYFLFFCLRCFAKKPPCRWSLGFFLLRNLRLVHPDQQGRRVSKEYTFNTNYSSCGASHV